VNINTSLDAYALDPAQPEERQINQFAVSWSTKHNKKPDICLVSPLSKVAVSNRLKMAGLKIVVEELLLPDVVIIGKELLMVQSKDSANASKLKLFRQVAE